MSGGELGQVVLGWVELKLYQEGLYWVRLGCDGWVRIRALDFYSLKSPNV